MKRHSENLGGGKWGIPGGRLEAGEDAETAALRELREETNIDAPGALLLGAHEIKMPHGKVHMTSFKMVVPDKVSVVINPEEHHTHEWFNLENLLGESGLLWGVPTVLRDFGLMKHFETDPTLADGSEVQFLYAHQNLIRSISRSTISPLP